MGWIDRDTGFSLVELMIVIAIMSVLTVGVTLSIGSRDRRSASDVTQFQNLIASLRTQAIVGGQPLALEVGPDRLTPLIRSNDGLDPMSGGYDLQGTLEIDPAYGVVDTETAMLIHFLPDGRSSAFEARFGGAGVHWRCIADGWTPLKCAVLE